MDLLAVAVRFSLYGALGLLFGLAAFGAHGLPTEHRAGWKHAVRPLLIGLAVVGLLASVAGVFVLASRMFAVPIQAVDVEALGTILTLPGLGAVLLLRGAALVFFVGVVVVAPTRTTVAAIASGVALSTLAWFGHASASDGWRGGLHLMSTVLHLVAAGLWTGALAAFLVLGAQARAEPGKRSILVGALGRFHLTGSIIVGIMLASGIVNTVLIGGFPVPAEALRHPWGQLMILKLLAFTAMLGLAALNRFRLAPALARSEKLADSRLDYSLWTEFGLAIAILGLVAAIGLLSPTEAL